MRKDKSGSRTQVPAKALNPIFVQEGKNVATVRSHQRSIVDVMFSLIDRDDTCR